MNRPTFDYSSILNGLGLSLQDMVRAIIASMPPVIWGGLIILGLFLAFDVALALFFITSKITSSVNEAVVASDDVADEEFIVGGGLEKWRHYGFQAYLEALEADAEYEESADENWPVVASLSGFDELAEYDDDEDYL